jgi:hypothetical protein
MNIIVSLLASIFEKKMSGATIGFFLALLALCLWAIWMSASGQLAPPAPQGQAIENGPSHSIVEAPPSPAESR